MRLIDADRLKEVFHRNVVRGDAFDQLIDIAPTADAVEVVRCADCTYLGFKDFNGICEKGPVCGVVQPDSFCSWGKRRKKGGTA